MTRRINALGLEKIKQWEGLRLKAYKDVGGVWTVGYGSTDVRYAREGNAITEKQAEALLLDDLARFEKAVSMAVKVHLTDNQFAALVSFAFNVGVTAFTKSTLVKKLNQGNYDAVPAELARWNKVGKTVLPGLTNRRAAEAGLWATGAPVASAPTVAKADGGAIITPERVAMGATAVGSLGALSGLGANSPIQWALAAVIIGVFTVGGYLFLKERRG